MQIFPQISFRLNDKINKNTKPKKCFPHKYVLKVRTTDSSMRRQPVIFLFFLFSFSRAVVHFNEEDVRLADQGSDPSLTGVLRGLLSRSSSGCQPLSRVRSHGLQYSKALCQCESMKRTKVEEKQYPL